MKLVLDEQVVSDRTTAGPALYVRTVMPEGAPKAVLGMIHGYADHGARYAHVMNAFAEQGIGTMAIDLRGHGKAGGTRGFCMRFDEFLDDARELRRRLEAATKGVPLFLFGHSFGGLVASHSVLAAPSPFRGLLLSAPFFGLALDVPKLKVAAGKLASRVYPRLAIPSGLFGKDMTTDLEKARAYDSDPLVFGKATARWYTETTEAQLRAVESAPRLSLPLFVAFGSNDKVASRTVARRFFDGAASTDKTWELREGALHEVLNEPSWRELAGTMTKWILARA